MKRSKRVVIGCGLVVMAIAPFACRTPTELTIDVSTTTDCKHLTSVDIVVSGNALESARRADSAFPTTETTECSPTARGGHVGTLVVTPGDGDNGAVVVIAGLDGKKANECKVDATSCIFARPIFAFVSHHALTLPVPLDPSFGCS